MTEDGPLLELDGISHAYREDSPVLRSVDLRVSPGELVVIFGPSGSGKSTLLHVAASLLRPTEGRVRLGGRDLSELSPSRTARVRRDAVGILLQDGGLLDDLSALENVCLPLRLAGRGRREARDRATTLLEAFDLGDGDGGGRGVLHRYPGELSGGEIQRVALARALANEPALVCADEPTGNLDRETAARVVDLLREVPGPERAILLATHDPTFRTAGTRELRLVQGRLVSDGRP